MGQRRAEPVGEDRDRFDDGIALVAATTFGLGSRLPIEWHVSRPAARQNAPDRA
jgi:hypothetical protein